MIFVYLILALTTTTMSFEKQRELSLLNSQLIDIIRNLNALERIIDNLEFEKRNTTLLLTNKKNELNILATQINQENTSLNNVKVSDNLEREIQEAKYALQSKTNDKNGSCKSGGMKINLIGLELQKKEEIRANTDVIKSKITELNLNLDHVCLDIRECETKIKNYDDKILQHQGEYNQKTELRKMKEKEIKDFK